MLALEASPELCAIAAQRFANPLSEGRLIIKNAAICRTETTLFHEFANDQWGTISAAWKKRNSRLGMSSTKSCEVPGASLAVLMQEYGCPHYLKIDLEGADHIALAELISTPYRPDYISIESEKTSWSTLVWEVTSLTIMGYDQFLAVPQHLVHEQHLPRTAAACEGLPIDYRFPRSGSSGAFGADLEGPWMSARQLLRKYRAIFLRYVLFGDNPTVSSGPRKKLAETLNRVFGEAGWWDTHATFGQDS